MDEKDGNELILLSGENVRNLNDNKCALINHYEYQATHLMPLTKKTYNF